MQNKEISEEKSVNEKNLEVFNRYFPGCLSIENDNQLTLDIRKLKALLGDFSEIKEEGYGLDFVGKKIALNQAFKKNHKILKPLNESTSKHILIKGDNLDALKILKQSYSEKIKMIYIDPPYNTKNDNFIYGDDFSQSNEEVLKQLDYSKEKLDYIKNLFGLKSHSGWLSFMYPRLLLARDLLKQDGVIFISIDDNEVAQLKLLCDEIFGEGNFVSCFVWRRKTGASDAKGIATITEYILCYVKDNNYIAKAFNENTESYDEKRYRLSDKHLSRRGKYYIDNLDRGGVHYSDSLNYGIECPDGTITYPNGRTNYINEGWVWTWGKDKLKWGLENDFIEFRKSKTKESGWAVCYKNYLYVDNEDNVVQRSAPHKNLLLDILNTHATSEMVKIFEKKIFTNPKPTKLISRLIELSTNEGDIILDFFAGSGTTAHAVLESNKSDYQKLSEGGGVI